MTEIYVVGLQQTYGTINNMYNSNINFTGQSDLVLMRTFCA